MGETDLHMEIRVSVDKILLKPVCCCINLGGTSTARLRGTRSDFDMSVEKSWHGAGALVQCISPFVSRNAYAIGFLRE